MMWLSRGDYAPRGAYLDEPQSIGYGATISAPYVISWMASAVRPFTDLLLIA